MEAQESKEPTSLMEALDLEESGSDVAEEAEATEAAEGRPEAGEAEAEDQGTEDKAAEESDTEAVQDEAAKAEPKETDPAPTDRATTPSAKPFAYSADRTEYAVPDAVVTEIPGENGESIEMIVMPRASWNRHVQPNLADRGSWYRKEAGYQKQLAQLNPEKNPTVVQAKKLLEQMEHVLALDEDAFGEWVHNYRINAPILKSEAEKAALQAQLEQRKSEDSEQQREVKQREDLQTIERDIPLQVQAAIERLGAKLPEATKKQIIDRLWNRAGHVYVRGWEGNPHGLEVGELRIRTELVDDEVRFTAQLLREAGVQDRKAVATEKKNQVAVGSQKKRAPTPAVPAKGSPAPGGGSEKDYASAADFYRDMGLNR